MYTIEKLMSTLEEMVSHDENNNCQFRKEIWIEDIGYTQVCILNHQKCKEDTCPLSIVTDSSKVTLDEFNF